MKTRINHFERSCARCRSAAPEAGRRLAARSWQTLVALALVAFGASALVSAQKKSDRSVDPSIDRNAYFDQPYSDEYEALMIQRIRGQINDYFSKYNETVAARRSGQWQRDLSSVSAYLKSVEPQRAELKRIIGLVDEREPVEMEFYALGQPSARVAETSRYTIDQVRWPVFGGIRGEGLLLRPRSPAKAHVVALPDADQTPEQLCGLAEGMEAQSQFARRLAESGAEVLVPTLISRGFENAGHDAAVPIEFWQDGEERQQLENLELNQTHREIAWRQAYIMGRHVIGYETQKVLAGLDWFEQHASDEAKLGVAGYGEGGLLALYSAAVDPRIEVALVSGYFGPRETLPEEPIERMVWGLLNTFGDAEIASLIAPRQLIVEYSEGPSAEFPVDLGYDADLKYYPRSRLSSGQPGSLWTPDFELVRGEVSRCEAFFEKGAIEPDLVFVHGPGGQTVEVGSEPALAALLEGLGAGSLAALGDAPRDRRKRFDPAPRQARQLADISDYLETWIVEADFDRYRFITGDLSSPTAWERSMEPYRDHYYNEIVGRLPDSEVPLDPDPQMRQVFDEPDWRGYEVVWNALPGIKGWGLLAVPKGVKAGEKRPTVVAQHGAGGSPTTPLESRTYHKLLPQLCERGFVVFSPHAPYNFDVARAMPLKASVYSVIIPQYQQMMRWLTQHEHVDADRIGYYGKSWGGRTALRVPPYVPEFKFAICSAYFNQGLRKNATRRYTNSYMNIGSIGIYEFGMGPTYGHAELAGLIAPRPFLVENGYFDNVKPDEWAGYEFAKVKRLYELLGVGDRAVWGSHVGGHEMHADTIFPFIHKHLYHPAPAVD